MLRSLVRLSMAVSLFAAVGGVACSRAATTRDESPPELTFNNESLDVVTVYALRPGGDAARIVSVSPGRSERLRLPPGFGGGGTVTIIAVPMSGNRAASSGPLSIRPGVRLVITLPTTQNILSVLPSPTP